MSIRISLSVVALAAFSVFAQGPSGEIGGRMTDQQRSALPGVRIRIVNGDQSRETITDRDGRFSLPSVAVGTYRVTGELAGFKTASGTVTISSSTPSAFLAWSLEVGCLTEIQRVIFGPKDAARLVNAIVHMRVASPARNVLFSVRPDCEGRVLRQYVVEVLDSVSGRGRASSGPGRVLMELREAGLVPGHEYLALLWPDWSTSAELVLPITSGRVTSTGSRELNGLSVREALTLLAKWSEERLSSRLARDRPLISP